MPSQNKGQIMATLWTFSKCALEAYKYTSRTEFKTKCSKAYTSAIRHGWINMVCKHMPMKTHPKGYWTKERCRKDALKYDTIKEYKQKHYLSWAASNRNRWSGQICSHMKRIGNRYNKCIYAYEFPDNSVYVGLTYNIENRQRRRDNRIDDPVTKHIIESGLTPVRKQLTDYICVEDAIKLEGDYVKKYKDKNWIMLNRNKTGSIGGNVVKWTYFACKKAAIKYQSRRQFKIKHGGAYSAAYNKGWLDDICSHMPMAYKPKNYWTYENCQKEAKKYKNSRNFKLSCQYAWNIALKNKWLNDFYIKRCPNKNTESCLKT